MLPEDGNQFPDFRCDVEHCQNGEGPCEKHAPKPPVTRAETALRKLLADVQVSRKCYPPCSHKMCRERNEVYDYLERLAREGLGEPAPTGTQ